MSVQTLVPAEQLSRTIRSAIRTRPHSTVCPQRAAVEEIELRRHIERVAAQRRACLPAAIARTLHSFPKPAQRFSDLSETTIL
jgi:hypothetical protein